MKDTVLILGAKGRFGLAAVQAFRDAGWRVVAQSRPGSVPPMTHASNPRVTWVSVALDDTPGLAAAARGAGVVIHALNPAYTHAAWRTRVLPMMDNAIAVARTINATLMLPGNVYNFGSNMPTVLREDTPQAASTVKGQIRVAMEARLKQSGVRGVVIRAGDFFGSGAGSWLDQSLVKSIRKGTITYPGALDVPTAWAYLPDLARSFVAVAQRREGLAPFETLHFAGHSLTGQQWLDAFTPLARAQGWVAPTGQLKFKQLPWPIIRLGAVFNPVWAALMEMRYLWQVPHALANDRLVRLIGCEPHTPLPKATALALADLGLIGSSAQSRLIAAT